MPPIQDGTDDFRQIPPAPFPCSDTLHSELFELTIAKAPIEPACDVANVRRFWFCPPDAFSLV